MSFKEMKDVKFYITLGLVMLLSSILTMIFTQIIKIILKKKRVIYEEMEESKRDMILSRIGRIVALIVYSSLYIAKELYFKNTIVFDGALITGVLTGATGTLIIAKGIYTILHQWSKKNTVFERLEYAEKIKDFFQEELNQIHGLKISEKEPEGKVKNTWTLTNKKK